MRPLRELLFEAVDLQARLGHGRAVARQLQRTLDETGGDHRPCLGAELDGARGDDIARGDAELYILWMDRREQIECSRAALDAYLRAAREPIDIELTRPQLIGRGARKLYARAVARDLERHDHGAAHRLALIAGQCNAHRDRGLAIRGRAVAPELNLDVFDVGGCCVGRDAE